MIEFDLKELKTKKHLLNAFQKHFDELYALNYDALIDVLTIQSQPLTIAFKNMTDYEDLKELNDIINIILNTNSNITILRS